MSAIVVSFVITFVVTAVVWLSIGSRLRLSTDDAQNDKKNLLAYFGMLFPAVLIAVFYLVERI